jgi:hypothetical protein
LVMRMTSIIVISVDMLKRGTIRKDMRVRPPSARPEFADAEDTPIAGGLRFFDITRSYQSKN